MRIPAGRWFVLLAVLALLLAACGSDGDGASAPDDAAGDDAADDDTGGDDASGDDAAGDEPDALEELVEAAQADGQLTIQLSGGQEPAAAYAENFTERFGIPVSIASFGGNENWERFQTGMEAGRPPADITFQTTVNRIRVAAENGWLEEFTPSADPQYPDALKDSGQWYAPWLNAVGFAWSEIAVSDEENERWISASNEELWDWAVDPVWTDRVVTAPPHGGGSNELWWYYVGDAAADTLGDDYIQQVVDLNPQILTAARSGLERMTAGEWAQFHGVVTESLLSSFYAADSPIRWRYPEPTPVAVWGMGIASGAENPDAARLWMEWMTSVEGQEALSTAYLTTPANPEAEDTRAVVDEPWFSPAGTYYTEWIDEEWLDDPAQVEERLYKPFEEAFDWRP